jgi:multicomponent Na+:H+ antiporter subunit B
MSARIRSALLLVILAAFGVVVVVTVLQLPSPSAPPPPSARLSTTVALHERHVTNTVAGITFDLRGVDTLGEELILFCAAVGAALLLRGQRGEEDPDAALERADALRQTTPESVRLVSALLAGPLLVFGAYIVTHGTLTPGGGFQGGVILAAVALAVYVGGQVLQLPAGRPVELLEIAEALGAAAFALVAVAGLVFSGVALANFIALGTTGQILSGGTILVLQVSVGVEVAAALTLILTELLDQALVRSAG